MKEVKKKKPHKNSQQVSAGRAGGLATAKKLSQEQRSESARNAGKASGVARSTLKIISDSMCEESKTKNKYKMKDKTATNLAQEAIKFLIGTMNNEYLNYVDKRVDIAKYILSSLPVLRESQLLPF